MVEGVGEVGMVWGVGKWVIERRDGLGARLGGMVWGCNLGGMVRGNGKWEDGQWDLVEG